MGCWFYYHDNYITINIEIKENVYQLVRFEDTLEVLWRLGQSNGLDITLTRVIVGSKETKGTFQMAREIKNITSWRDVAILGQVCKHGR